ncbi:MAG: secretin N-terminal domain-containing protein [Planctomycetota bacterium]|nr:secretin N-terminal domain-containing protein [Planctomycetota bacterium]
MKKFSILATLIVALLGTSPLEAIQATGGRVDLVTIDVRDKDLAEVLSQIGEQVNVNIVVDPQVSETVTLSLDAIGWHDAIEIIARQTNCVIIEQSDRLIRFTQPPSLNIEFQDAELAVVLDLLAKQSGANIVIAEEVQGKVSLTLRDVPWREALETIVKTAGYVVVSERSGISEILRIVSPDKLIQQQETRIYRLRYVRPPEQYIAIISDIDKQAGNVARDLSTEVGGEFTLLKALRSSLSPGGEMDFDKTTNSIIVKDIAPRLDEIEEIIKEIDVEPALVQVEVKFISTTSDDILEAGLKFDNPNTPGRDGFRLNAYGSSPLSGIPDLSGTGAIVDPALGPVFPGSVAHNGGTWPFDIGNMQSIGVPYQALGVLDFTQTQLLLSMVKDDENSKIIQQPFLTTLDNHPSTIFVGEEVPFAVQNVQQDQNGNVTVSIDENPRSPVNVGFTLYVSPHVIPDTDMIDMCVIPKVSTLVGNTSDIPGFDRFRFSDPGSGNSAYIDIPHESSQTVVTYLRVRDGQTAVIGGLHTERRIEIESGLPLLSSIPYLGELFKWRRRQADVDHLLILVTPRILKNSDDTEEVYQRALREAERYDYFKEKYGDESEDSGDSDDAVGAATDAGAAGQG